jgi:hypothetical protein
VPEHGVYRLPDGQQALLYGGLGYRYWLGTPGQSGLVSGLAHFWQAVPEHDRAEFEGSLKEQLLRYVRGELARRTGLWPSESDLDRIEWLVIWGAEPDLLDRLVAFEQGWSRMLPAGRHTRELTGADISQLARRAGLLGRRAVAAAPRTRVSDDQDDLTDRT